MGREELIEDPRFAQRLQRYKNMDAFVAEKLVSKRQCQRVRGHHEQRWGTVQVYTSTQELFDHPQLIERGAFKQLQDNDGAFKIQNPPFQFAGSDTATADTVPELGEHTVEVLTQLLGYDADTIQQLYDDGVAHQYA